MKLLLTKKFTFEMAHALDGYNGKCANLHGHSYHLEVTVEGGDGDACPSDSGMVADFHTIKDVVQQTVLDRFDHALVLKTGTPMAATASAWPNTVTVPFNPTTENLLVHFATLISPALPPATRLHSLRLAETDTSVAELIL